MSIFIFSKKETALKALLKKSAGLIEFCPLAGLSKFRDDGNNLMYLDISSLTAVDAKRYTTQLKKRCKDSAWGIIDPKGGVKDPALLFFEGASDYLGPGALKTVNAKRFKAAASCRVTDRGDTAHAKDANTGRLSALLPKTGIVLPAGKFPGWKALPADKTMNFFLLYCSLQAKTALNTQLGETAYAQMYQRFIAYLRQYFQGAPGAAFQAAEGQLWIDSGKDCLFLLPPKLKCAGAAVTNCMRLLLSAPLIANEVLNLRVPVNFVFALHYGSVSYRPPGKTGMVVSDAVNFIFHLGAKKAETGRLTISGELPDNSVPAALEDCFVFAGEYEGRKIWHTKKFSYLQPWI
jgi:hypothetical protein